MFLFSLVPNRDILPPYSDESTHVPFICSSARLSVVTSLPRGDVRILNYQNTSKFLARLGHELRFSFDRVSLLQ